MMDLSEFNLEIVHKAGALLHTVDALSRLGYTKAHAHSVVEQLRYMPRHECSVEKLKPVFEKVRNGEWLRARVAAVESGIESSFKELHDRLALDKATARYVKESDEETSRTVEMYDMVSLVSTRSGRLSSYAEGSR